MRSRPGPQIRNQTDRPPQGSCRGDIRTSPGASPRGIRPHETSNFRKRLGPAYRLEWPANPDRINQTRPAIPVPATQPIFLLNADCNGPNELESDPVRVSSDPQISAPGLSPGQTTADFRSRKPGSEITSRDFSSSDTKIGFVLTNALGNKRGFPTPLHRNCAPAGIPRSRVPCCLWDKE